MTTTTNVASDNPSFVSQMRPALVKYFRRKTGNAVEAEDLAHDVLVRALAHAHWRSPSEAKGYIFRTAVNRWRDRRRRSKTQGINVAWGEEVIQEISTHNSPERVLIVQEELAQIAKALEEMGIRTRTVLMLIKFEQMKIATVADMLGISVSAVNKHLAKGLARLAEIRHPQDGHP
jgi:RNA polymerase sigma factor (sigma-70 family)